jgi:TPR repeat protein
LASRSAEWHALYQRGEFEQLVQTLRPAAQAGNTVAQTTLGVLLAKGLGTEADPNMAKLWLRRAAARGDVCASQALGALDR